MSVRWALISMLLALILSISPGVCVAQEIEKPAPTTQVANTSAYDGKAVFPNRTPAATGSKTNTDASSMNLGRWSLSLGVVIGLIFLMGFLSKKLMNPGSKSGADAMTVLARQNISPKQQLMLVQVGRRVVMVGNSGGQMNALSEITDPDEIADVMSKCNRRKKAAADAFSDLFGKAEKEFEPPTEIEQEVAKENEGAGDAQLLKTKAELGNLLEKVRGMTSKNRNTATKDE
jgi:flagellar protein FliO/FliZ